MSDDDFRIRVLELLGGIEKNTAKSLEALATLCVGLSTQVVGSWNASSFTARRLSKDEPLTQAAFDKSQADVLGAAKMLRDYAQTLIEQIPENDQSAELRELLLKKNDLVH